MARKNLARVIRVTLVLAICFSILAVALTAAAGKPSRTAVASTAVSSVVVTVRSVTGRTVDGAQVQIFSGKTKFSGVTGADGTVTISGVPQGTYYLGISHHLFADSYYSLTLDEAVESYTAIAHPKSLWEGIGY